MAKLPTKNAPAPTAAETGLLAQRRAGGAAALGLAMQLALAVVAFILDLVGGAQPGISVTTFAAAGVIPWVAILIVAGFRRAATVEDYEVEAVRRNGETSNTIFESELDARPAARRLERAYKFVLPAAAALLGLVLAANGFSQFRATVTYGGQLNYSIQNARLVAGLFAGFAFAGFVLGRYLLGLGDPRRRASWGLLRGGATYLIGTVYVFALMAVSAGAKGLGSDAVNGVVRYVVPLVLLVVGVEVLLNLVLDLYRPRAAGEAPKPAFDSRLLNLLSSPGGVVRSLGEAVNYQFGFEITQSWFWRLLSRSFVWLLLFGVLLLVALSSLVIVQPQEMALVTRFGRLDPTPLPPGLHLKSPWPFSEVDRYPATRINSFVVGSHDTLQQGVNILWTNIHGHEEKLLTVAAGRDARDARQLADEVGGRPSADLDAAAQAATGTTQPTDGATTGDAAAGRNAPPVSLAAAEVFVQWKIDPAKLVAYATSSDRPEYRLRQMADAQTARELLKYDIDTAIGPARVKIAADIERNLRAAADRENLGVEVVWVGLAGVHPPQAAAEDFNLSAASVQRGQQSIEEGRQAQVQTLTAAAGSVPAAEQIIAEYDKLEALRRDNPKGSPAVEDQQARLQRLVQQAGGNAAQQLLVARALRWREQNQALGRAALVPADYAAYLQAPEYYRQRRYLRIIADALADKGKTVITADNQQLDVTFDYRSTLGLLDGVNVGGQGGGGPPDQDPGGPPPQ